jgi:hypothetical protein
MLSIEEESITFGFDDEEVEVEVEFEEIDEPPRATVTSRGSSASSAGPSRRGSLDGGRGTKRKRTGELVLVQLDKVRQPCLLEPLVVGAVVGQIITSYSNYYMKIS